MEATGRYEFSLAEACYGKGLPVVIAKPISVRRYAGAIDQLAKTDKIDAMVINHQRLTCSTTSAHAYENTRIESY